MEGNLLPAISEKYTKKKGQIIPVRETWVGPKTVSIEGKTYLVEEPGQGRTT
jgi:hypothetical protein